MDRDHLPTTLRARAGHASRLVGAVAAMGARRLIRRSDADDEAFGTALVGELDALKGMAMKVGQILSYLDGAVPEATQVALARLQRGGAPLAWARLAPRVEAALGAPIAALFDHVDPVAVAAASIGQVHRAVLRGAPVAVKVQYPDVAALFEADVVQLRRIASLASLATRVDGAAIVEDLRSRLLEECDYLHEARAQAAFAAAFADDPGVVIPAVHVDRSAATVLTTAWHDGEELATFSATAPQALRDAVGATLARFAWRSLFAHAAIHADPHPGNQRFCPQAVVLFDFGCVRRFNLAWLDTLRRFVRAVLDGDRGAHREATRALGLVADDRGFDWDQQWAMDRWTWEPYLGGAYTCDRGWAARGVAFSRPSNPNLRRLSLPPASVWLTRLTIGLHAVLGRLGARGRFDLLLRDALDTPAVPLLPETR
jgi:predicted unusual protein kinase regulating ubiquinone biosynthesis (AarF/ABC1/UbiB family)